MEFSKIIAISGKPGLFEILSQTKSGVIVKSLIDGRRMPVNATNNVGLLENISIYTYETEVPLTVVLKAMADKENGKETISHKASATELTDLFLEVLPDYDQERVYTSNIKKIVQWYNILVKADFDFSSLTETEEDSQEEE